MRTVTAMAKTNDTISRAAAINALKGCTDIFLNNLPPTIYKGDAIIAIKALPPTHPEQLKDVKDILEYLDTVVHPLMSPEHWNVYSELHDMISGLLKHREGEKS